MPEKAITPKCPKPECGGTEFASQKIKNESGTWLVCCQDCGTVVGAVGPDHSPSLMGLSYAVKKIAEHLKVKLD